MKLTHLQHAELALELAKADAFNEAAVRHLDRCARKYEVERTLLEKALRKALEILEGTK